MFVKPNNIVYQSQECFGSSQNMTVNVDAYAQLEDKHLYHCKGNVSPSKKLSSGLLHLCCVYLQGLRKKERKKERVIKTIS